MITVTPKPYVTNGPEWKPSTQLPGQLPTPAPTTWTGDFIDMLFRGRVGDRDERGTSALVLGIDGNSWSIAHGSFDEAVAAARDISSTLWDMENPSSDATVRGTIAILQAGAGYQLLRAGTLSGVENVNSFELGPNAAGHERVVKPNGSDVLALVSPARWIDLRLASTT